MPYISKQRREELSVSVSSPMESAGELNYAVTQLIKHYVKRHGLSYQTINDIGFALEGAKLEFYRRVGAPYEDIKCIENGDVYGEILELMPDA